MIENAKSSANIASPIDCVNKKAVAETKAAASEKAEKQKLRYRQPSAILIWSILLGCAIATSVTFLLLF